MTARPPKEILTLDMPFGEALERFMGVDPKEMHANIAKSKKKKPPGGKKKKSSPPGKKLKPENVISMREGHMSLRRRGLRTT
jgi:hypothetical protein